MGDWGETFNVEDWIKGIGLDENCSFSKPRLNTNHLSHSSPSLNFVPEKPCTVAPVRAKTTVLPLSREITSSIEIVGRGKPDWNVAAILCGDGHQDYQMK